MDVLMHGEHGKLFHQGPAIALLARESKVSIDSVARLYAKELAKLEIGARIRGFLHIFAIKKVREILLQHGANKPALAQARGGWNGWIGRAPGAHRGARRDARLLSRRALPASTRLSNSTGGAFLW
jgi:hypothetical protein